MVDKSSYHSTIIQASSHNLESNVQQKCLKTAQAEIAHACLDEGSPALTVLQRRRYTLFSAYKPKKTDEAPSLSLPLVYLKLKHLDSIVEALNALLQS